jgi:cysteine desulfurase
MAFYFDHNATTPVSPEVAATLARAATEVFGNPSSIHGFGQTARNEVEKARRNVATLLGCEPKEVVFTSGGTEADNLALLGVPEGHLIVSAIEHPAVLGAAKARGHFTVIPVDGRGVVDPGEVRSALQADTVAISVMHANNETGVIQPLAEIAEIARDAGVLLHSDGVQGAGKLELNMRSLGVDLYAISAHKLYAPKGTGALYVREGVKLNARQFGGRHERERRPGTENVPGIAALGEAANWLQQNLAEETARLALLRDKLEQGILNTVPQARVNGAGALRTPNVTNIQFSGIEGEALLIALDLAGFAVSSGAACSSGAVTPSHVLTAMGLSAEEARSSLRFSLGRINTEEQVDALIAAASHSAARLRKLSPAWSHA